MKRIKESYIKKGGVKPETTTPRPNVTPGGRPLTEGWQPRGKSPKVWSVTAESESGDDYGPYLYWSKPTEEQLTELAKQLDYSDGSGPGYAGSWVYFDVKEVEINE